MWNKYTKSITFLLPETDENLKKTGIVYINYKMHIINKNKLNKNCVGTVWR